LGPTSLVLYDVTTLYFETDKADGFREPGFSKERRLEPQITLGLLTDATGAPLMVEAFEGNKAGEAEPVRQAHRRHPDHQPRPGIQGPCAGGVQGIHHQHRQPHARSS
jgi:hypothetical protein